MKNPKYRIYKANISTLIDRYPIVFNKKVPRPLAIGIYQEIVADTLLDESFSMDHKTLRSVLCIWTGRHEYLREIIKPDSKRYHLNGGQQGLVEDEHRSAAIARNRKNRLASKRAREKRIALEEQRVGEIDKEAIKCLMTNMCL